MKKSTIFLFFIIIILALSSCNKDEGTKLNMPDINIIDISGESNWDYCVIGTEDYYFIKSNGSLPEAVLYHSSEANKNYSIFFSNNGYIDKVYVDGYIFTIRNPNGNKIDIGIIYPNGNIEIIRDLETDYDWGNYNLNSGYSLKAWSDVVRWTGRIVSGVPCAISAAVAVKTLGLGTPLALWACGNYLLGLSADIMQNEFEIHNGFTHFVDAYGAQATIASCGGGDGFLVCASDLTSRGFSEWADHLEVIENRNADVQLVDAALEYGYGDVQITLTWDNIADLDLHVIDPFGERIYWNNQYSSSNGILDVDDIDGYGPENIYWPPYEAPAGNYEVYVHMYPWNESDYIYFTGNSYYPANSNYTVLVNAFGQTKKFAGSISFNETVHITTFDQNGINSANINNAFSITKSNKMKK